MSWTTFGVLFLSVTVTIAACRVLPAFILKGKQISERMQLCLNLIAPAAFGALVANDIFTPGMFEAGIWPGCLPVLAAVVVFLVAYKTKSMIICCLAGIGIYAVLYAAATGGFVF